MKPVGAKDNSNLFFYKSNLIAKRFGFSNVHLAWNIVQAKIGDKEESKKRKEKRNIEMQIDDGERKRDRTHIVYIERMKEKDTQ